MKTVRNQGLIEFLFLECDKRENQRFLMKGCHNYCRKPLFKLKEARANDEQKNQTLLYDQHNGVFDCFEGGECGCIPGYYRTRHGFCIKPTRCPAAIRNVTNTAIFEEAPETFGSKVADLYS